VLGYRVAAAVAGDRNAVGRAVAMEGRRTSSSA
jgi:hypothetical protein